MNRIVKWIVMLSVILLVSGSAGAYAAQAGNVYDDAALLTGSEIDALNEKIAAFCEESGWNVYAVTTEDAQGKSAETYADDFFDGHSPGQEDGVVFLIDMDNREIALSGGGDAQRYLTDERIDAVLEEAYGYVSEADYAGCLYAMVEETQGFYRAGIPKNQYNYNTETGEISAYRSLTMMEIIVSVLLAIAAGGMVSGIIIGKYRLKLGTYQYEYHEYGKVQLRVQDDRFVSQTVTHRHIPQSNGGGGAGGSGQSSTHTSSSGSSHVGGSRKF